MSTGAARRVLPWLREGVRVQWVDNTPPDPFVRLSAPVLDPEHRSFVNEELLRLLEGGMLREIPREEAYVSCKARVEPKRVRLVVNHRGSVNQRAVKRGIRLETLAPLPRCSGAATTWSRWTCGQGTTTSAFTRTASARARNVHSTGPGVQVGGVVLGGSPDDVQQGGGGGGFHDRALRGTRPSRRRRRVQGKPASEPIKVVELAIVSCELG